ncbi:recombinase family protein [Ramlibacter sp. GTP1]|uniref:Recombinase family protein n=2 Tax=Ramlibacter albus TaxID=2079448 RepID=A0A923M5E0_9BURK|nr:recombinase family protein [Ramlibacter albus]
MSTDQQPLSIESQRSAISLYARDHGYEVVATYLDQAKSGVKLSGRDGMQALLRDVMNAPDYKAVLVLDVSRWGRFQDVDESAYYEYHCRKNGVQIVYVGELFRSSSSPFDAVMKQLKRTMAAEYSRELAHKSRSGQVTAIKLGFATGRPPCLGYRREAISADGSRRLLAQGERKPRMTDRVRWILGPKRERDAVAWVFEQYAYKDASLRDIARALNRRGVTSYRGEAITDFMVRNLLEAEVVTGKFTWGLRSGKTSVTDIPRLAESAANTTMVPALVDRKTWDRAQERLRQSAHLYHHGTDRTMMLRKLAKVVAKHPALSWSEFGRYGLVHASTYQKHFGSLAEAYRQAGARAAVEHGDEGTLVRTNKRFFLRDLYNLVSDAGAQARAQPHENLLWIGDVAIKPRVAKAKQLRSGARYWLIKELFRGGPNPLPWLLVLCEERGATTPACYYLLNPEQHAQFRGRIERGPMESGLYDEIRPSCVISRLCELATCS